MAELGAWWRRLTGKSRHALVGRPELWRMKRAFQIEFLRAHGLRPTQTVVDIGCGSLRGGIALIDYLEAGRYVGIDVRAEVLAEARRELARERLEHKRPRLIHAQTLSSVRLDTPADVCWAFSVLFHMSDAILEESLAWVARQLAVDGVFYANVIAGDGSPGQWQGFPVVARSRPIGPWRQRMVWSWTCWVGWMRSDTIAATLHRTASGCWPSCQRAPEKAFRLTVGLPCLRCTGRSKSQTFISREARGYERQQFHRKQPTHLGPGLRLAGRWR